MTDVHHPTPGTNLESFLIISRVPAKFSSLVFKISYCCPLHMPTQGNVRTARVCGRVLGPSSNPGSVIYPSLPLHRLPPIPRCPWQSFLPDSGRRGGGCLLHVKRGVNHLLQIQNGPLTELLFGARGFNMLLWSPSNRVSLPQC
jgi:hypothetical protein